MKIKLLGFLLLLGLAVNAQKDKINFDEIKQQCEGLKPNQRIRLSVSSFDVSTVSNPGQFGDELAQMLTDALQNVNCFKVLLSLKDIKAIDDEGDRAMTGNTKKGSGPTVGKQKGAQVVVLGKVTSFASGEKRGGALGINITGGNKAKIGFIIQLINAESREIIASKSIEVEGKASGVSGVQLAGITLGGSRDNKAVQEICQKGIIKAVEFIASKRDEFDFPEVSEDATAVSYNANNCLPLKNGASPRVMVILPEFHITQRIPDPAGETEINRRFLEAGFKVIDPAMFATISKSARFIEAAKNPMAAISLGKQFGADLVLYGEAFSERTGTDGNRIVCRARTEVRVVRTDDASMVATHGLEAGASDLGEFVAAKSALRSAASETADYLLQQICKANLQFKGQAARSVKTSKTIEIELENADYSKLKKLNDLLLSKYKIVSKTLVDGKGEILVEFSGNADAIADYIDSKGQGQFSITNLDQNKISVIAK